MRSLDRKDFRRLRAAVLVAATILVLAAGVLPACANALCCAQGEATKIHAAMPCCDESSMAPRQTPRLQPATTASLVADAPLPATEAAPAIAPPPAHPHTVLVTASHHDPSPPLFLRNEQFLI